MIQPVDRLLRRVVSSLAAADERQELLADLDDEARRRAIEHGRRAADRWRRRQLLSSLLPLLARRLSTTQLLRGGAGAAADVRVALRSLAAAPVFAISIVVLLAVAIGSHTVVYAVVDGLLLRPLPFGDRADRLITLHSVHPALSDDWDDAGVSYLDLVDFRRETNALEAIEGIIDRNVSVSTGAHTERVLAASVTPGLFAMLGVTPAAGRAFTDADAASPGFEQAVILSHGLWQSLMAADTNAIGRSVLINGRQIPVIGVMPPGFAFPDGNQVWLPYRAESTVRRSQRSLLAIGLLRRGTSVESAAAELGASSVRLASRHPETNKDWGVHVQPLRQFFASGGDELQLLAAVTLLLVGACANVVGLIVSRGVARQGELALRAALGGGRLRLIRLLAIENVVLAAAGAAIGVLLASWGLRLLLAWIPEPPPYWALPALDARVAMFAACLTGAVTLVAAVAPAIRLTRVDATGVMLGGTRTTSTREALRLQRSLVVAQVAASFALLIGAALMGRSATALIDADGGFDRSRLLSLRVYMAGDRYDPIATRAAAVDAIERAAASVPGVRAATATGAIPTDDGGSEIRLRAPAGGSFDEIGAQLISVTSTFWSTLGLDLIEGRAFTGSEMLDPMTPAIIVNRRLAAKLWPNESAIDRPVQLIDDVAGLVSLRVVGVAPDLVYEEFGEETGPSQLNLYVPYVRAGWRSQALLIQTAADPAVVVDAVVQAIRGVDPGFAVFDVMTMEDRRAYNHWADRFLGQLFWTFAAVALLLACVGAYAIAAYGVTQRRREIGVRMAVGAGRGDIVRMFLGGSLRLALAGGLVGAPLAVATARTLESELFRVSAWDPFVWTALPLTLVAAVAAAAYLPARRAARVDPAQTLRA